MKASSKRNHFDVITSKFRLDHDYCVGQVFLSVVQPPTMNYSYIHLVEIQQMKNSCKFAMICASKG